MDWITNIKQVYSNGTIGKCPFCGSNDTDYIFVERESARVNLEVWCNFCNERTHADCRFAPENRKRMRAASTVAV